jgi:hypothetical protein
MQPHGLDICVGEYARSLCFFPKGKQMASEGRVGLGVTTLEPGSRLVG